MPYTNVIKEPFTLAHRGGRAKQDRANPTRYGQVLPWKGAGVEPPVNFFHLGMSVSAYGSIRACLDEALAQSGPACRFEQLSSGRGSAVQRRNEVGLLRAPASQASSSEGLHARGTFAEPSSTRARMLRYCVAASAGRAEATPSPRSPVQPKVILDCTASFRLTKRTSRCSRTAGLNSLEPVFCSTERRARI